MLHTLYFHHEGTARGAYRLDLPFSGENEKPRGRIIQDEFDPREFYGQPQVFKSRKREEPKRNRLKR